MKRRNNTGYLFLLGLLFVCFVSCERKDNNMPEVGNWAGQEDNQSPKPIEPQATFTATPSSDNPNLIIFESTTLNISDWLWDFGNGQTSTFEKDSVLYENKGSYHVQLTVKGPGGESEVSKEISIEEDYAALPDPNAINTDFTDGGDLEITNENAWTYVSFGPDPIITFGEDGTNFIDPEDHNCNGAIYREIEVDAATYIISAPAIVSAGSKHWFEIYFGGAKPVEGKDYKVEGDPFIGVSGWATCGKNGFDGDIATDGCSGELQSTGEVTFSKAGKVYVVIKAGAPGTGNMGENGITLKSLILTKK